MKGRPQRIPQDEKIITNFEVSFVEDRIATRSVHDARPDRVENHRSRKILKSLRCTLSFGQEPDSRTRDVRFIIESNARGFWILWNMFGVWNLRESWSSLSRVVTVPPTSFLHRKSTLSYLTDLDDEYDAYDVDDDDENDPKWKDGHWTWKCSI